MEVEEFNVPFRIKRIVAGKQEKNWKIREKCTDF
jgi:hypothetical protein